MTFPRFWAIRCGPAARQTLNVPVRFVLRSWAHSSGDVSTRGLTRAIPAPLTRMSIRPNSSRVRRVSASTSE
jgi:hypothetical protein